MTALLLRLPLRLLLLAVFVAPVAAQSFDHEDVFEKSYAVRHGSLLMLDADLGAVRVVGTDGGQVRLRVVKGANDMSERAARDLFRRFDLSVDGSGGGLAIRGRYDRPRNPFRMGRLHVRFEIEVPRGMDLSVRTAGGSIQADDVDGDAKLRTAGGSITARQVSGAVDANTSGGSVTAERIGETAMLRTSGGSITAKDIRGDLQAVTSGGSIRAEDVRGDLRARTSGGSIHLAALRGTVDASTSGGSVSAELVEQPRGPVSLETSGGSVTLSVDRRVRANLVAEASGGRVTSDVPVKGRIERNAVRGEINGGGPLVTLRSHGGSVSIRPR